MFEDQLREMFGTMAYPAFTVDKLVINIVRTVSGGVCCHMERVPVCGDGELTCLWRWGG